MKRELASGILSVSLILGGALAGAAMVTKDSGDTTGTKGADRVRTADHSAPQDIISEDGVTRIWGTNRYGTAAQISEAYGWGPENVTAVYIASGLNYPDALAIGLTSYGDGPLLLVSQNAIPAATREELTRLQPCVIDVLGGSGVISDAVFDELKTYADPTLCGLVP
jgi:hypothetical protein